MAAAWMSFLYGVVVVVFTVAEGAPSSSSSSSSSSSGGGVPYPGDLGGAGAFAGNGGAYAGGGGGGFYFPGVPYMQQPAPYMPFDVHAAIQQQLAALAMLQSGYQNPYMFPAGNQGGFVNTNSLGGDNGMAAAAASGPDGGISLRIGPGDFPANEGGGSFSTFSSSSSSDVDGQTHRQSTVGVNDNGRIYFKTASSP